MKKLVLLLALSCCPLFAQNGQAPLTVDDFTYLSNVLDSFVQGEVNIFVSVALNVLQGFALWVLVFLLFVLGVESVMHRTLLNPIPLLKFIWTYGLLTAALHYYAAPLPLIGSSIHTMFSDAAGLWGAQLNLQILTAVFAKIDDIHAHMQAPWIGDLFAMGVYYIVIFILSLASGIMQAITAFGYVALGVGAVLGPLSIMLAQLPWFSHLLHNWIHFMFKYAMWRLVASSVVYVWGNTILHFLTWVIGADYSAGHFVSVLAGFMSITIAFAYALFMVPSLVSDLYGGSHSGGAASAGIVALATRIFTKRG